MYMERMRKGTTSVINFEIQHYNEKSLGKFWGEKSGFSDNNLTWPKCIRISFSFTNCLQFAENHSFLPAENKQRLHEYHVPP